MISRHSRPLAWGTFPREWWAIPLLLVTAWLAHFLLTPQLGLYEDDYLFIGDAMGRDWSYIADRLKVFQTLPQGRPLGFFIPQFLSFIGDHLGGLETIYVIGWMVVSLNAVLAYLLFRKIANGPAALAGALMFLLFPADTTKSLLIHSFQLQPSLTFLLAASLAYLSGRKPLSYLLIVGSLTSYESTFLVFAGIPLLKREWNRALIGELIRHAVILAVMLAVAVGIRLLVGDSRAAESAGGLMQILPRVIGSLVLGPVRAILLFGYGPVRELFNWNFLSAAVFLISAALIGATLWTWRLRDRGPTAAVEGIGGRYRPWLQLAIAGAVLLVLAYALAFTHYPPNAVYGRGTSVHMAATLGGSVLFAAIVGALLQWAPSTRPRNILAGLVSAYLALLVTYHLAVQRDYAESWTAQRAFWADVIALAPDVTNGTVVLFQKGEPEESTYVQTNSWADALVLDMLFAFPRDWQTPPRLFTSGADSWKTRVEATPDGLRWWVPGASWDEHWEPLPQNNVIVLDRVNGRLTRLEGTIQVANRPLTLKPRGATTLEGLSRKRLYDVMLATAPPLNTTPADR